MKLRLFLIACLVLTAGLLTAQNIFGAFQVITEPRGATVTVYGTNQYLGTTPTQSVPITMDQNLTYNWGVPGRVFDLVISKRGFIPIRQQIFVPYNHRHQRDALRNPTLFHFSLARLQVQPHSCWPHWNPTSYYYFVDPSPGYGGGNHGYHGPGAICGPGGNHNPGGHNSGSHGSGYPQGGPGGNNNQEPGYNPPSGGHAGHPRP